MRLMLYVVTCFSQLWLRFSEDNSATENAGGLSTSRLVRYDSYVLPSHAADDCLGTDAKGRPQRVLKKLTQEVSVLVSFSIKHVVCVDLLL